MLARSHKDTIHIPCWSSFSAHAVPGENASPDDETSLTQAAATSLQRLVIVLVPTKTSILFHHGDIILEILDFPGQFLLQDRILRLLQ